ncbi:hypothetical protein CQA38_01885 [Campylobacter sp. MIT 12-5580]|uniref:hypothetical protein n=1 Tax=Campylobacter sp. MIT 12-5580 TaxID=2040651 RepID=UPI0010F869BE|nr:hypothetical protein [Campylobacter sp. MIT 12-5580]TKX29554.1 hypothetical protein CQA38_01885 [Campylobacter sp. MIT 12-5580]
MADLLKLKNTFKNYEVRLKEAASKDNFICESDDKVIYFDEFIKQEWKNYIEQPAQQPSSFDALKLKGIQEVYCIEFAKNTTIHGEGELKKKFEDSFKILQKIFQQNNINHKNLTIRAYVVYEQHAPRHRLSFNIHRNAIEAELKQIKVFNKILVFVNIKNEAKTHYKKIFNAKNINCFDL